MGFDGIKLTTGQIGNGESEKAWALIGSLTRTVDYLRLTVEPEDNSRTHGGLFRPQSPLAPPVDFIEEEERRRLFWNVFNLDRFCSSTTGWVNCVLLFLHLLI